MFDVLVNADRRIALSFLLETNGPTPLSEVVETVARGTDGDEVTEAARDRVSISFHHNHLPKMTDAGLIEFDEAEQTVTATAETERIQSLLDSV